MKKETEKTISLVAKTNEGVLPAAMQSVQGSVLVPDKALDLRSHCEKGNIKFSIAGNTDEGQKIEFHIFSTRNIDGIRPSEQYDKPSNFTQFIGLASIGDKKVLSNLTFGSSSAEAARDVVPLLQLKSKQFGSLEFIVTVELEKVQNKKKQEFGIARFSFREATQSEIETAIEALTIDPDCVNKFRDLPNIDA